MTRTLVISLILAALAVGTPAQAHPTLPMDAPARTERVTTSEPAPVLMVRRNISASEAKRIALRRVPGEVVDISRNGDIYRVRIVASSGRVVDVRVDARTGRIVG